MFQIKDEQETTEIERFRPAETDNDFHVIFENELKKHPAKDREEFREFHIEEIQKKAAILQKYDRSSFYEIIEKAKLYVRFLSPGPEPESQPPEIKVFPTKDKSDLKNMANELLIVLSGNWINGEKIMTDAEYTKVVQGVFELIDNKEVEPIQPKINTLAPLKFVRRLFREINTELYGKGIKDCFIAFLHGYFECFSNTEKAVTKSHFNEYKNSSFQADYKKAMESINK
jgi:hypothetical protein